MKTARKSEFMLLFVTLIWGGTFPSIKVILNYVSPFMLMALRFTLAFIIFTIIQPFKKEDWSPRSMKRGLVLGLLLFLGHAMQTIGLEYTSASRSGFITYFYALLTPLFQYLIIKKRPTMANLSGLILAFTGLILITGGLSRGSLNKGDLITLAGAAAFSLYIVCISLWGLHEDSRFLTSMQMLLIAILSFISAPFLETIRLIPQPLFWLNFLYLSLLGSIVAVYIMTRHQSNISPTKASVLYAMEPVFSALFAVLIINEAFSLKEAAGSGLVIAGVIFSEIMGIRQENTSLGTPPPEIG